MMREAIVLAGGLGTRLRTEVPDLPKCMAPVAGRPFLSWLIDYLEKSGVDQMIFALGYRHEVVESFLSERLPRGRYVTSIEPSPLGTGGAIRLAAKYAETEQVFVLNGDTYFPVGLKELSAFHETTRPACTLALKPVENADRYGAVETAADGRVTGFTEKKYIRKGMINGGVYALDLPEFSTMLFDDIFSFELDFLQRQYAHGRIFGIPDPAWFIDIGVPEDYRLAQTAIPQHA